MSPVITLILLVVAYMLPTLIAATRSHKNVAAIACLNIFTGWTAIGWVVSLVWCFTYQEQKQ